MEGGTNESMAVWDLVQPTTKKCTILNCEPEKYLGILLVHIGVERGALHRIFKNTDCGKAEAWTYT